MNRIHTTVAIACLCAVIVGWQVWTWHSAEPGPHSVPPPIADSQPADPIEAPITQEQVEPSTVDPIAFADRLEADPNCFVDRVVLHPETGEPVDAIACDPAVAEPRPYESWSEPVLAGLAYGDPVAAEVLGLRHIQSEDPNREALGLMLLYRSVALSGETEALHRAISERYATVSKDGEPNIHNLKQLLVFAIVATRLGDTRIRPGSIEARLANADVPDAELLQLKQAAEDILLEMASIESEITGNSTIREALTNA